MLSSLRSRLILSHLLPLLVIIPLMGIALVYVLETQVLLPNLSNDLLTQARLVSEIAMDQPDLWSDSARAQAFVARVTPRLTARLMLLDSHGRLLASSDPADAAQIDQLFNHQDLPSVLSGQQSVRMSYSQRMHSEVADVLVPVTGAGGQVLGVVRLTHQLVNVYELFLHLRYLTTGILVVGLILGGAIGMVLALDLERPLQRVTQAVDQLAEGRSLSPLPIEGPEQVRLLLRSFNTLVDRLRTLEQNRRQLLANLTHELGRPLGALHSATQALLGGADQDEALRRELLVGMDDEIGRLTRLLDDLSRLREQLTGELELSKRPVALSEWLVHLLAPRREAAREKGLQWHESVPLDLPALEIDPDRLAQAVGNLVSNAIQYTPAGGVVSVKAGLDDERVWLRVSDTGPGIARAEQARIFTPFYRGQAGRRFPQGMGLGLSITRDLVIAHGGRLELESALGSGSDFTIWLPFH